MLHLSPLLSISPFSSKFAKNPSTIHFGKVHNYRISSLSITSSVGDSSESALECVRVWVCLHQVWQSVDGSESLDHFRAVNKAGLQNKFILTYPPHFETSCRVLADKLTLHSEKYHSAIAYCIPFYPKTYHGT